MEPMGGKLPSIVIPDLTMSSSPEAISDRLTREQVICRFQAASRPNFFSFFLPR